MKLKNLNQTPNNSDEDPALIPMPQLDAVAGRQLTKLQQTAERTNGVVTPANAITLLGLGLEAAGCYQFAQGNHALGLGIMAVGACCDALDGFVARQTRTANYQVGRYLDIGADGAKAIMLAGTLYSSGVYSGQELVMNYGPKVVGWAANGISRFIVKNNPKTSQIGRVAEQEAVGVIAKRASRIATVASCAIGSVAAGGYIRDLITSRRNDQPGSSD